MVAKDPQIEVALHLVSTPIGAARDITLRALDILRAAPVLAAEDTRSLRRLLEIHGVALEGRKIIAYHDHSGEKTRARIVAAIESGQAVAYASEAGTPLVADPGYQLAAAVRAAGLPVRAAPGASAVLAALAVGGLPTDRFLFVGFLPAQTSARRRALEELKPVKATLVIYEAPGRVHELLDDSVYVLGDLRRAAVCRELTKRFEDVQTGTLADLTAAVAETPPRGEVVVLIDRPADTGFGPDDIRAALAEALRHGSVKDAAAVVAENLDIPRRMAYQMALEMERDS